MNEKKCFQPGTRECGFLCGGAGALVALCLILFGIWNCLLIVALFVAGYYIGSNNHKVEQLKIFINRIFPPKGE